MFREPWRDKVLRKAAGDIAGGVGGCLTSRPDNSIDRLHLWIRGGVL
jgi:hypothetical protein